MENFDIEQAVQSYLAQMTPEQRAMSDAYFEGGYWLILWNLLYSLFFIWLFMRSGWSARLSDWAKRRSRFGFLNGLFYFTGFFIYLLAVSFPFSVYQEYFREHQYGLSNLTFPDWLKEQGKAMAVTIVIGSLFLSMIYLVIRRAGRRWWAWASAATMVYFCFAVMITPVYISPLFNDYKPLAAGEVRNAVLSMASANGIDAEEVWWFDASKQSKRVSANVSGLGSTMRISLNDNLLNRTSLPEIRAVMGHEIGHYVLNHVQKTVLEMSLIFIFLFFAIDRAYNRISLRYGRRWRFGPLQDLAGAPVFVGLLTVGFFVLTPVFNTVTRVSEIEADQFGLNLAREPDGFAQVSLKLGEYRKMSPGPLEEFIFFDHPSGENRIRMAMRWKKENLK